MQTETKYNRVIKEKLSLEDKSEIYMEIAKTSNAFTPEQVRVAIKYAIDHRNEQKSIQNFKEIFGYEYDEEMFNNKDFLEKLARVV